MNVLLNWIEFPESVQSYLIKGVSEEDFELLKLAHNTFINWNDEDEKKSNAVNFLTLYIEGRYAYSEETFGSWVKDINFPVEDFGKWQCYLVKDKAIISTEGIDFVCVSGWYL